MDILKYGGEHQYVLAELAKTHKKPAIPPKLSLTWDLFSFGL